MGVVTDIVSTYRQPRKVMRRLLAMGRREDRPLVFVMAGCTLVFLSQWPVLARKAHFENEDLNMLLGAALLGWVVLAPLMLYCLSGFSHILGLLVGRKGSAFAARLALFWALLASSPLILLNGLVGGFIGQGPALQSVGAIWLGVFLWFWLCCMSCSEGELDS